MALSVSAAAFTVVGLTMSGVDREAWLIEAVLWTVLITGVSLITVPAPSGTRLSLGIGAVVSASILMGEVTAFGAAVSAALAISWIL
ncbi:MAG: hypothetical protein JRE18_11740, partial [Deltaproteobacteria bacterium]|nr:hypothetical protein [Deltaproteobacteria bacterium]